jgi:hypothetical protein
MGHTRRTASEAELGGCGPTSTTSLRQGPTSTNTKQSSSRSLKQRGAQDDKLSINTSAKRSEERRNTKAKKMDMIFLFLIWAGLVFREERRKEGGRGEDMDASIDKYLDDGGRRE